MDYDHFGVIDVIWPTEGKKVTHQGHIRVLARLRRRGGVWQPDPDFNPRDLGSTEKVFLTDASKLQKLAAGTPVRFSIQPSSVEDLQPGHDRYVVGWNRREKQPEVEKSGAFLVLAAAHVTWRSKPRVVDYPGAPEDVKVYGREADFLIGPFNTVRGSEGVELQILQGQGKKCFRYPLECVSEADRVLPVDESIAEFYLLNSLPEGDGQPVDLATGKQLAKWLLEEFREIGLSDFLRRLDQDRPGWRRELKDRCDALGDPAHRALMNERYSRFTEILEVLDFGKSQLEKLLESPHFEQKWEEAIETRRSELEADAKEKARSRIAVLDEDVRRREGRIAVLEQELSARRTELANLEQRTGGLIEHFRTERERLLRDFIAFEQLLRDRPRGTEIAESAPAPMRGTFPRLARFRDETSGPLVGSSLEFVRGPLLARLRRHIHPAVREDLARLFHCLTLSCRAALVPDPGWTRAYVEALGEGGRGAMLQVEPHWMSFRDVWEAGLGTVWEDALANETQLHVLHLQDFDRALPECWFRPCLDLLAGLCDGLTPASQVGWPENLRIFASPAPDAAALPLSSFVVRHFAALCKRPVASEDIDILEPSFASSGGVLFAGWKSWQPNDSPERLIQKELATAGAAALEGWLGARADLERLFVTLKAHETHEDDEEADDEITASQWAQELRLRWPMDYEEATG